MVLSDQMNKYFAQRSAAKRKELQRQRYQAGGTRRAAEQRVICLRTPCTSRGISPRMLPRMLNSPSI